MRQSGGSAKTVAEGRNGMKNAIQRYVSCPSLAPFSGLNGLVMLSKTLDDRIHAVCPGNSTQIRHSTITHADVL